MHNGLRSRQISTYVGKIVNATGLSVFAGGGRGPEYMVQPLWKIHASGCNYQLTIISLEEKATHLLCHLQINWQEAHINETCFVCDGDRLDQAIVIKILHSGPRRWRHNIGRGGLVRVGWLLDRKPKVTIISRI